MAEAEYGRICSVRLAVAAAAVRVSLRIIIVVILLCVFFLLVCILLVVERWLTTMEEDWTSEADNVQQSRNAIVQRIIFCI